MSAIFLDVNLVKAQIGALRHNYPELADDTQLLADSLEGETNFQEVITRLIRFEREADFLASAVKAQEEALAERRARFVKQSENYRGMIKALMEAAGQKTLRLPEATVAMVQARPGIIVTNPEELPDEFWKVERTPMKKAITDAILSGRQVPGAELKNTATHLTIRI